jgi:hypothetical protein
MRAPSPPCTTAKTKRRGHRTSSYANQTQMRERLLTNKHRSRQPSAESIRMPLDETRCRSQASKFLEKFSEFAGITTEDSTSITPPRSESPLARKQRLSYKIKSQARIAGRPKTVVNEGPTQRPRRKTYKDVIVTEYHGQQKQVLKLLKYTVPRSLMTIRQQLALFGKVSVSFRRIIGDF